LEKKRVLQVRFVFESFPFVTPYKAQLRVWYFWPTQGQRGRAVDKLNTPALELAYDSQRSLSNVPGYICVLKK